MSFCRILGFVAVFTAFCGRPVHAATITSTKLKGGDAAIFLTGNIEKGDSAKFRDEAQKYSSAFVVLESQGGSTIEAIRIGQDVRLKGFSTAVLNDSFCNSACALIWLAGSPRALAQSARVGFHATYTDEGGRTLESGVGNAIVGRYLTLLNLPEKAVIFATSAAPSRLNYLTSKNFSDEGIDVKLIDDIHLNAPPPLIQTVETKPDVELWSSAGAWKIEVDHTLGNGCFLMTSYDEGTVFRVGVSPSDHQNYIFLANDGWQSLKANSKYQLEFKFDSNPPWRVPAIAEKLDDAIVLIAFFSDANFWKEFGSSAKLSITKGSVNVATLRLDGSLGALAALSQCQSKQTATSTVRDPFAD